MFWGHKEGREEKEKERWGGGRGRGNGGVEPAKQWECYTPLFHSHLSQSVQWRSCLQVPSPPVAKKGQSSTEKRTILKCSKLPHEFVLYGHMTCCSWLVEDHVTRNTLTCTCKLVSLALAVSASLTHVMFRGLPWRSNSPCRIPITWERKKIFNLCLIPRPPPHCMWGWGLGMRLPRPGNCYLIPGRWFFKGCG